MMIAKKRVKVIKRFGVKNRTIAISLIKQAKASILRIEPLPAHVANYLLEAFHYIEQGENAERALGLQGAKGQPPKRARDFEFARSVNKYLHDHLNATDTEALNALCKPDKLQYKIADEWMTLKGIESALKKGRIDTDYVANVSELFGDDFANDLVNFIQSPEK